MGEPAGRGAIVSSEYFDDPEAARRGLRFRKRVCELDMSEARVRPEQSPERVLIEDRPSRENVNFERQQKAHAEGIVIESFEIQERFSKSGFFKNVKCGVEPLLGHLLRETPDYLNFFPGVNVKESNLLHERRHLLSTGFVSRVYSEGSPINIDKSNFFESDFEETGSAFSTFVTANLPLLSLKMHLLSLIFSKKHRTGFGLMGVSLDSKVGSFAYCALGMISQKPNKFQL